MTVPFTPRQLHGRWRHGQALDLHTLSSAFLGHDEFGRAEYATTRSEVGELLYRLKYGRDFSVVPDLVDASVALIRSWEVVIQRVVAVPPSKPRPRQPVHLVADGIARALGVPFEPDVVHTVRDLPQLKDVFELDERARLLHGAHRVDRMKVEGRTVLVFDDLYRSGATLNQVAGLLYNEGGAAEVFALTLTRTRSHR